MWTQIHENAPTAAAASSPVRYNGYWAVRGREAFADISATVSRLVGDAYGYKVFAEQGDNAELSCTYDSVRVHADFGAGVSGGLDITADRQYGEDTNRLPTYKLLCVVSCHSVSTSPQGAALAAEMLAALARIGNIIEARYATVPILTSAEYERLLPVQKLVSADKKEDTQ